MKKAILVLVVLVSVLFLFGCTGISSSTYDKEISFTCENGWTYRLSEGYPPNWKTGDPKIQSHSCTHPDTNSKVRVNQIAFEVVTIKTEEEARKNLEAWKSDQYSSQILEKQLNGKRVLYFTDTNPYLSSGNGTEEGYVFCNTKIVREAIYYNNQEELNQANKILNSFNCKD